MLGTRAVEPEGIGRREIKTPRGEEGKINGKGEKSCKIRDVFAVF